MSPDNRRARKFISGRIKLLNMTSKRATAVPNKIGDLIIDVKLIPEALMAFISLSSERRPKVINVASNTAIGTDKAIIQARFKNKYSKIVNTSKPFPRKRSIARSKKLMNKRNVIMKREKKNGGSISLMKYLERRLMPKITVLQINLLKN